MKRLITVLSAVIGCLILMYLIIPGFMKRGDVYISDWRVSEDGTQMEIRAGVMSSAGYIRSLSSRQEADTLYLDWYGAFGGINGSIGAKNDYTVQLNGKTEKIAIYRGSGSYETVLVKEGNIWKKN